jgi:hypothetical protein
LPDLYVKLLNEMMQRSRKRHRRQLAFIAYVDLLWAPAERFANPDRFVLFRAHHPLV